MNMGVSCYEFLSSCGDEYLSSWYIKDRPKQQTRAQDGSGGVVQIKWRGEKAPSACMVRKAVEVTVKVSIISVDHILKIEKQICEGGVVNYFAFL